MNGGVKIGLVGPDPGTDSGANALNPDVTLDVIDARCPRVVVAGVLLRPELATGL